jgi:uncharacterized protein (TIGR02145 family)
VTYHGYDYQLVEIGEKCWFQENLRTVLYTNGDSITECTSGDMWQSPLNTIELGVQAMPDYNDSLANIYGRTYNGAAVVDDRGVCPSGWHVATDEDWIDVEMEAGLSEIEAYEEGNRGDGAALAMHVDGDNSLGLSLDSGGWCEYAGGGGDFRLHWQVYWSSTFGNEEQTYLYWRRFYLNNGQINRAPHWMKNGCSIRCVAD